jgi:hypothetical protein
MLSAVATTVNYSWTVGNEPPDSGMVTRNATYFRLGQLIDYENVTSTFMSVELNLSVAAGSFNVNSTIKVSWWGWPEAIRI